MSNADFYKDFNFTRVMHYNVRARLIPKYLKMGLSWEEAKLAAEMGELWYAHGAYRAKTYFKPKDFNKGEYALLRPIKPAQELLAQPETVFGLVSSSNLLSVAYLQTKKILEIEFRNGYRYRYYKVAKRVFNNLMRAMSHGKYFWRRIRRQPYAYRRIA